MEKADEPRGVAGAVLKKMLAPIYGILQDVGRRLERLENGAQILELQGQVRELQEQVVTSNTIISAQTEELAVLKIENSNLQTTCDEKLSYIDTLTDHISQLEVQNTQLRNMIPVAEVKSEEKSSEVTAG